MIVEPKKKYKQTVQNAYRITQAVLDQATVAGKVHTDLLVTIDSHTYILATLSIATPQCPLNMELAQNDNVCFSTRGEGTIHLTGFLLAAGDSKQVVANASAAKQQSKKGKKDGPNTLAELMMESMNDDEDEDEDVSFDFMDGVEDDDDDDDDSEEGDDDSEEGDDDSEEGDDDEQLSFDEDDDDEEDDEEEEDDDEQEAAPQEPPSKKAKKENKQQPKEQAKAKQQQQQAKDQAKPKQQQQKKEKADKPAAVNGTAPAKAAAAAAPGKIQTMQNGVKVKDLKEGSGPVVKAGKKVVVYYEGRLQSNNKMFDSCKSGKGFNFQLGRGEVIRGWDVGVMGMRVGGKRQIICPPDAAYGKKGQPPVIPPNSTLVFDVEVRSAA